MFDHHKEEESGDIKELILRYHNLKQGRANAYIEEDGLAIGNTEI